MSPPVPQFADLITEQVHRTVPPALILTAFVISIAYVRSAQAKALIYSLPVPFSCAYLAARLPINATYATGLILVVGYNWAVYLLHTRLRVPLLLAIALSAGGYFVGGVFLRPLISVPIGWVAMLALTLWFINVWLYRAQAQPDHRSRTAWYIKAPAIFVISIAIYNATRLLAGAVGTFPYAGIFTSYEMRHSLRTLAGQFSINSLGILLCMLVISAAEPHMTSIWALLLGWIPVVAWALVVHRLRLGRPIPIEE